MQARQVPQWPVVSRFVVDERFAGEQGGQQEPTSQLPVQEQGVLADPAQAGQLGELAFQERGRIDHAANRRRGRQLAMKVGQGVQPLADHVVIVGPPGISGDPALAWGRLGGLLRAIGHGQHEQAARAVQDVLGVLVGGGPAGDVLHLSGKTVGEPLLQGPQIAAA